MASASRFSEEEFQEACAELQRPRVSGWEIPVVTSVVKVYQRPLKKLTGLHEYKVSGIVRSPPDLLADVYMDLDYRKQWDQYVQELYEIKVGGEEAVYWQMKYPFPMSNRDVVYVRQRRDLNFEGRKVHVILAQSISVPWFSEKSGMIRVKQYKQSLAIQSYDSWRSEVFMYYFNNPGGQIPFWILNNFTKSEIPGFLRDLEKACLKYHRAEERDLICSKKDSKLDFPGGPVFQNPPDNAGAMDFIPVPGRFAMPLCNWACAPQLPKPVCSRVHTLQQKHVRLVSQSETNTCGINKSFVNSVLRKIIQSVETDAIHGESHFEIKDGDRYSPSKTGHDLTSNASGVVPCLTSVFISS
ncbi:phosphatidylcholine transfer protein-like [Capricornis sumatraensis]|uniref:phosphatidylcholine transfer protein-like n=1 Tax=Capricornis sumatraensis TaxID=34865 RepID=UPI0036047FC9